jgi:hypothetical protein
MTNPPNIDAGGRHVPGVFKCAVCGFQLFQATIRASDGAVGDRDQPGEQCPNDGYLLGRVTWEAHAHEVAERATEYLERMASYRDLATGLADAVTRALSHIGPQGYFPDIGKPDTDRLRVALDKFREDCGA